MATELDVGDIQGDILRAYGNSYVRTSYVFVNVTDPVAGRAWLSGVVDRVTNAAPWRGPKPPCHTNLAFTCTGLLALGVPPAVVDSFSDEFRQGMAGRALELGDVGQSAPEHWDHGLGTGDAHVLVTLNALDEEKLNAALGTLHEEIDANEGVSVLYTQHAVMHEGLREHFGYMDGFSQPAIEGATEDRTRGGGVPEADGRWRPLAPGEFILGYEDEDSRVDPKRRLPSAPDDPLGRNGTYMFWRKLYQDVGLFRRTVTSAAEGYDGGEDLLKAKIVGRWQDGTPLVMSPDAPDPDLPSKDANDFRYADADPRGMRCPIGSHVRRTNPRDSLGWDGKLSFRHRIIRRGMPYGPRLPEGVTEDDHEDRGLVFVGFNASIARQFEGIQTQWVNDGNIFHLGHDRDYLIGTEGAPSKMTVQGDPPYFLTPQPQFVITRGGEYLYVPGLTALGAIADGVTG